MVAKINGQCYTNDEIGFFFSANARDCALTDREIVSPSNPPIDAGAVDSAQASMIELSRARSLAGRASRQKATSWAGLRL